jgi:hypothetical protein
MMTMGLASGSVRQSDEGAARRGCQPQRHPGALLLALVERELYYLEGLGLAAEVDVQGGAWC